MGKSKETLKDKAVNRILEKISDNQPLTTREKGFLNLQQSIPDHDLVEYMLVTPTEVVNKISDILDMGVEIVCNLRDRDGVMGAKVLSGELNEGRPLIEVTGHGKIELRQNCLYDLRFSTKHLRYSLESDHEFYELVPVKNED
jgi:hypothetical protein